MRRGIELTNFYTPAPVLSFDADAATTTARFLTDPLNQGTGVPESLAAVISAGATVDRPHYAASLSMRYFGPRVLDTQGDASSPPSMTFNAQLTARTNPRERVTLDVFNLFDARTADVTYYYESWLKSDAANPVAGAQPGRQSRPWRRRRERLSLPSRASADGAPDLLDRSLSATSSARTSGVFAARSSFANHKDSERRRPGRSVTLRCQGHPASTRASVGSDGWEFLVFGKISLATGALLAAVLVSSAPPASAGLPRFAAAFDEATFTVGRTHVMRPRSLRSGARASRSDRAAAVQRRPRAARAQSLPDLLGIQALR